MMDQQERKLLAQEIGIWIMNQTEIQTKHLIEAMPCLCEIKTVDDDGYLRYTSDRDGCNRCHKLDELNKD